VSEGGVVSKLRSSVEVRSLGGTAAGAARGGPAGHGRQRRPRLQWGRRGAREPGGVEDPWHQGEDSGNSANRPPRIRKP